jgi:hypothetical protein
MVFRAHLDAHGLYDSIEVLILHCPDGWTPLIPKLRYLLDHFRTYKKTIHTTTPLVLENLPIPLKQKLDPILLPIPPSLPPTRPRSTRKIPLAQ